MCPTVYRPFVSGKMTTVAGPQNRRGGWPGRRDRLACVAASRVWPSSIHQAQLRRTTSPWATRTPRTPGAWSKRHRAGQPVFKPAGRPRNPGCPTSSKTNRLPFELGLKVYSLQIRASLTPPRNCRVDAGDSENSINRNLCDPRVVIYHVLPDLETRPPCPDGCCAERILVRRRDRDQCLYCSAFNPARPDRERLGSKNASEASQLARTHCATMATRVQVRRLDCTAGRRRRRGLVHLRAAAAADIRDDEQTAVGNGRTPDGGHRALHTVGDAEHKHGASPTRRPSYGRARS